jgi:membrane-bound lytic murein transglycosylase F
MATMRLCKLLFCAALLSLLCGCEQRDALEQIRARGELVVVSRNSPTTYYLDKNGPTGFEYALAQRLAQELGVELRMETAFNLPEIFSKLQRHQADLAAAGLTLTEERTASHPHTAPYLTTTPLVVSVAGGFQPRSIADLAGLKIVVLAGSSHAEMLRSLQKSELPDLQWEEIDEADTMQLLELLNAGHADLAILDANEFTAQQSLYPRLQIAFDLGAEQAFVWYLAPAIDNTRLQAFIDKFIQQLQDDGTLTRLNEQYFGHTKAISPDRADEFARHVSETLPLYEPLIKQVAHEYQMEWQLLAALAYKESQWDPKATSPTGVRGMMMLTEPTARDLGVDNRLDAAQSLRGGARYLKDIVRRLPKHIKEPDRTWMALAAYNIGLAHLEDARVLTQRQGGDPNQWPDVMERLPMLQQTRYFKDTRYGYARGLEAVALVQNIRHYRNILALQEIPDHQPQPPERTEDYLPDVLRGIDLLAL